jgi:hypothetical protein
MSARHTQGRSVAVGNGLIASTLIVIVAAVSLVVNPPAPPGIAEFAPQANKAITKAPLNQSSRYGRGAGACATGQACGRAAVVAHRLGATPFPTPSTSVNLNVGVPSALQCYAWPDGSETQTFDPQSPPCVAGWPDAAKGNGGATSPGVEGTTIRIAIPELTANDFPNSTNDLIKFFNSRFQFYGRHLVVVPVPYSGAPDDPSVEVATAHEIGRQLKVFASGELTTEGDQSLFRDTLAGDGVLSVLNIDPSADSREFAHHAPYEWSYGPTTDTLERMTGKFACTSLVGKPTAYAGQRTLGLPRKLAIVVEDSPTPMAAPLEQTLASCGVTAQVGHFTNTGSSAQRNVCVTAPPPAILEQMLTLQKNNVTTIIPLENEYRGIACLQAAASSINYQPEWLIPQVAKNVFLGGDATQVAHTFGIVSLNKPPVTISESPYYEAIRAVEPGFNSPDSDWYQEALYHQLLVLASGIQAAGPKLTPATFQTALQSLTFPNPGAAAAPFWQGTVGFPGGEHAMIRDSGLWWLINTQSRTSDSDSWNTSTTGVRCVVGRGTRWTFDTLSPNIPLQTTGPCR